MFYSVHKITKLIEPTYWYINRILIFPKDFKKY